MAHKIIELFLQEKSYVGRLIDATKWIQVASFFLILIIFALGQIARWDLLDQVAMVDRYKIFGQLYPDKYDDRAGGVSVYFPGVALLIYLLSKAVASEYLPQTMLVVAALFTIAFILLQREIARDINNSYSDENFWPLAVIFSLIFAKEWLVYAVEFKPDTTAYFLGSVSILALQFKNAPSRLIIYPFFWGFLAGLVLAFKQQYIAFIVGYVIFSVKSNKREHKYFSLACLISSILVTLTIRWSNDAWFWTVTVLSDDSFLPLRSWARDHLKFILKIALLTGACIIASWYGLVDNARNIFIKIMAVRKSSPWVWIIMSSNLAAFLGSWKVGGNSGNSAYGLILTLPFFLLLLRRLNPRLLLVAGWLAIGSQTPLAYGSIMSYILADDLSRAVKALPESGCARVITGSDVYVATRLKFGGCDVTNYWTISLRENTDITKGEELNGLVKSGEFKYVIIENWAINKEILAKNRNYIIVFENKLGIVARLIA